MRTSLNGFIVSLAALIAVLAGAWYMLKIEVDAQFGDGTMMILKVVLVVIGITAAIIFAAMHFTNAVHRTAGEDVVESIKGISGVFKEIAKTNGGVHVVAAKAQLEDKKHANKINAMYEKLNAKRHAANAEEDEWNGFYDGEDEDADVIIVE